MTRAPRQIAISLAASLLLAALAVLPRTGAAQSAAGTSASDPDRAFARELAQQAFAAADAGDAAKALQRFDQAIALYDVPTLRIGRADVCAQTGRLIRAAEDYRAALRYVVKPGDPPSFESSREQARTKLSAVEKRIPRLVVRVVGDAQAGLTVDGHELPLAVRGLAQPLDPGAHEVVMSSRGSQQAKVVELKEAQSAEVVFQAPSELPVGPTAKDAPLAAAKAERSTTLQPVPVTHEMGNELKLPLLVTSAALIAATLATGYWAYDAMDKYDAKNASDRSLKTKQTYYDHARLWQWINTGVAVGALAASGVTAYLYLVPGDSDNSATTVFGVTGRF